MNTTTPQDRVYAKTDSVVFRMIADECLLVPVRKTSKELDGFYRLNKTASRIWELIDGLKTVGQITEALTEYFDITHEECRDDVLEFLQILERLQAVEVGRPQLRD